MLETVVRGIKGPVKTAMRLTLPRHLLAWDARGAVGSVALTFDDGPDPEGTPRVLDELGRLGVRATFFLLGTNVRRYPHLAARIVEEGHEIANHSLSHKSARQIRSLDGLRREVEEASRVIEGVTGLRPRLYRPPYGDLSFQLLWHCWRGRITVVLWSYDTRDFSRLPVPPEVVARDLVPGDIVLMHDNHAAAVRLLTRIVPVLVDRSVTFATVSGLLRSEESYARLSVAAQDGVRGVIDG